MEETLLSLENVTKSRPSFRLGPIDLTVESGSVIAVVGPNSSGKTTLLHTIMNLLQPDTGDIRLFGEAYAPKDITMRQKIAYVPDISVGHEDLNAVEFGRFISQWYPAWNQAKYETLIQLFQVNPHTRFAKLSKGMKKALSLAGAFAAGPQLLLLDEPTSGLDLFAKRVFTEEVVQFMQDEQRTILLTTHILDDVRRLADYIALLHRGQLLGVYEKDTLINDWKVLWLDRIPERIDRIPGLMRNTRENPVPLMTHSFQKTRKALAEANVNIVQTQAMELDDILAHLIETEH